MRKAVRCKVKNQDLEVIYTFNSFSDALKMLSTYRKMISFYSVKLVNLDTYHSTSKKVEIYEGKVHEKLPRR